LDTKIDLEVLCRRVIGLTSTLSWNISKPNMLELVMRIWTDCEFRIFNVCFCWILYTLFGNSLLCVQWVGSEHSTW